MRIRMTKKQAVCDFRESILPAIEKAEAARPSGSKDWPMRRFEWNVYTDSLQKDGQITTSQYERWRIPYFLSGNK